MSRLSERVLLPGGAMLVIELAWPFYRLSWSASSIEVEYENRGGQHRRHVRGRASPYAFRSVEQMRYDFERDVEALGGSLAARA